MFPPFLVVKSASNRHVSCWNRHVFSPNLSIPGQQRLLLSQVPIPVSGGLVVNVERDGSPIKGLAAHTLGARHFSRMKLFNDSIYLRVAMHSIYVPVGIYIHTHTSHIIYICVYYMYKYIYIDRYIEINQYMKTWINKYISLYIYMQHTHITKC